jgi:putative ABC transport system permease protein
MTALRRFFIRIRNTVTGSGDYEARMREEMEGHVAMQAADNARAGLPEAEARRQAAIKFGSVPAIQEGYRAERALAMVQAFFRDVRYGVRNMRRSPGFSAVALLTLALGIGANVSIFSAINGILIEHLPYGHASRILVIHREQAPVVTPADERAIRENCPAFERLAVVDERSFVLTIGDGAPMRRWSAMVSGDFFPLLDVRPLLGRGLLPSDAQPGAPPVAVLSRRFWMEGFGGDPRAIGREIDVSKTRYTVTGVMPEGFELAVDANGGEAEGLWVPLTDDSPRRRNSLFIGLVKEGVDLRTAQAQIAVVSPRLAGQFPKRLGGMALTADTPSMRIDKAVKTSLWILQGAVALVLLLASVNLSALLIARGWSRHRELAIRKALGASRLRLIRQLFSESLVLALAGGALGLLLSVWGIRILRAIAPPGTPRLDRMRLDAPVLWFTFAVSVLAAVLFGLFPALQAAMSRAGDAIEGGLSAMAALAARKRRFWRNCLLAVEVALAAVLLVGGALMAQSFQRLMRVDTGVRADHALTMHVELSDAACQPESSQSKCDLTAQTVLEGVRSLPGVERAALSFGDALEGGYSVGHPVLLEGSQVERPYYGRGRSVTPGFFQAAGIQLLMGRDFGPAERPDAVIVSKAFADQYIGPAPLGKRFSMFTDPSGRRVWKEVVGVVNETRSRARTPYRRGPSIFEPFRVEGHYLMITARSMGDPMALAGPIQRVIRAADKAAIVANVQTLEQAVYDSAALPRFHASLFGLFAALALVLALTGVYGVTSYSVLQRTNEIAIRMALGARAGDVTRRIVAEGGAVALAGIALGMAAALPLTRFIRTLLFEIQPVDLPTYAGVAALLLVAVLTACYFPARTATRCNPVTILRHE